MASRFKLIPQVHVDRFKYKFRVINNKKIKDDFFIWMKKHLILFKDPHTDKEY